MINPIEQIILNHVENQSICLELMVKDGWQLVTPYRQPYDFDLYPVIEKSLNEFTKVDSPIFKVGEQIWQTVMRRIPVTFPATDKPEDLPIMEPIVVDEIIKYFQKSSAKYIYKIIVSRQPLFGYLPPEVTIYGRYA